LQLLTTLMCIFTGLTNTENPSKSIQWGSVIIALLFNIINGANWIWPGACDSFFSLFFVQYTVDRANVWSPVFLAFLYAVDILPLQYRSQVQSGSNMVFWFIAFLAVYFGGQVASSPNVGALIYIWFCLGGGIITILSWISVVESKCGKNLTFQDSTAVISSS
jgi:hypothetical protein